MRPGDLIRASVDVIDLKLDTNFKPITSVEGGLKKFRD